MTADSTAPSQAQQSGQIFSFDNAKKIGFIKPDNGGENRFFMASALQDGIPNPPPPGFLVSFALAPNRDSTRPHIAANIRAATVPNRPRRCPDADVCETVTCCQLHRTLTVTSVGPLASNLLKNTAGKAQALKSGKWSLRLCKHFGVGDGDGCNKGASCPFAHHQAQASAKKSHPKVPDDSILLEGELVKETEIVRNKGYEYAVQHGRYGKRCQNTPCTYGANCTFIHIKIADTTRAELDKLLAERAPVTADASPTTLVCGICSDDVMGSDSITCGRNHTFCNECFSSFVEQTWADLTPEPGTIPNLRCPGDGPCSHVFPDVMVAKHTTESACTAYLEVRQRARDAQTCAKYQQILQENEGKAKSEAARQLLTEQLKNDLPHALMCPRCKFGPVDLRGCSMLDYHQGERHGNGGAVNNSCPRCNFFTPNAREWEKWDGVLPSATSTPPPPLAPPAQFSNPSLYRLVTHLGFPVDDAQFALRELAGDCASAATFLGECQDRGVDVNSATARRILDRMH